MVLRTYTIAFHGAEAAPVEVQCAMSPGVPGFSIVGLPDKAVSEARERVRAALSAMRIAMPSQRITINLSPADMPKAGSHYDLPIALSVLAALKVIPADVAEENTSLGELSLDGKLVPVAGALPAAYCAASEGRGLLCPEASAPEAAWIEAARVIGARSLGDLVRHLNGTAPIQPAVAKLLPPRIDARDLRDVKGQERAKRVLEIAAAGRHHLLMTGSPGAGKSMLAARMPGLLPDLSPQEALETSMIHSVSGVLDGGGICRDRPFREPHHTASMAAIVGGGRGAQPGEISLAHNGVLFMDELPEFAPGVLETLRQPMETGRVMVSRANAHVHYPCRFLMLAAANPCRCGYLSDANRACAQAPVCSQKYLGKISGPLLDRFDLRIEIPAVAHRDLNMPASGDRSSDVRARVAAARDRQARRYAMIEGVTLNADIESRVLEEVAAPDSAGRDMLLKAADRFGLSARGFHRIMRVARTIADLDESQGVRQPHIAEALSYRITSLRG